LQVVFFLLSSQAGPSAIQGMTKIRVRVRVRCGLAVAGRGR
jgi:hypothetical protein